MPGSLWLVLWAPSRGVDPLSSLSLTAPHKEPWAGWCLSCCPTARLHNGCHPPSASSPKALVIPPPCLPSTHRPPGSMHNAFWISPHFNPLNGPVTVPTLFPDGSVRGTDQVDWLRRQSRGPAQAYGPDPLLCALCPPLPKQAHVASKQSTCGVADKAIKKTRGQGQTSTPALPTTCPCGSDARNPGSPGPRLLETCRARN